MEQKIYIDSSLPKDKQEETLMHEIIEVLDQCYGLGLNHQAIYALGFGLHQILKDNRLCFDDAPKEVAAKNVVTNLPSFGSSDMSRQLAQEAYDLGRKIGGA